MAFSQQSHVSVSAWLHIWVSFCWAWGTDPTEGSFGRHAGSTTAHKRQVKYGESHQSLLQAVEGRREKGEKWVLCGTEEHSKLCHFGGWSCWQQGRPQVLELHRWCWLSRGWWWTADWVQLCKRDTCRLQCFREQPASVGEGDCLICGVWVGFSAFEEGFLWNRLGAVGGGGCFLGWARVLC